MRSDRNPRAAQQPKPVRPVPKSGQTGFAQIGELPGAITPTPGPELGDPYVRFDRLDEGFVLVH